jgi:agmatinase
MVLLEKIFTSKTICGFDVVEYSYRAHDPNSAFAVAKIVYKMLGYRLAGEMQRRNMNWPKRPCGSLF